MDVFNKKRVEELEKEVRRLRDVEAEKNELKNLLGHAENELQTVLNLKENVPEDCTPGPYCEACEFSKKYYYQEWGYRTNHNTFLTGTICGKGESCKNFIQKEIKEK